MKNKVLCLLALLLSAITWMGDIFATTPVEIKEMSSFKNLPPLSNDTKPVEIKKMSSFKNLLPLSNDTKPIPLECYSALIKNLNELMEKDGGPTIKDFTTEGKILAQAALCECMEFLEVREYSSSNDGNVFSLDYSWPNIRRIAEKLADKGADDILKETFHRTKYAVKCINDEGKEAEYQGIVLEEIIKNLKTLGNLLEKIGEVESKRQERSRVTFIGNQINEFINLCVGEDAVFDITLLNAKDQGLFRARLGEMLQNYSGFQRICSILAMRLINTIMSRGIRGVRIEIGDESGFSLLGNKIYITSDVLEGNNSDNYYDQNNDGENAATMYHEMTHFFHSMINGIFFGAVTNGGFERSLESMVVYNICNSKHSLLDLFFPVLSDKKMGSIVREIKKKLENLDQNADSTKKAIYPNYQKVVQAGFGNLLFKNGEIDKLTFDDLCDAERLAKAIYIMSTCIADEEKGAHIWTSGDEMLTIMGIVPLFVDGDKMYMLENRQNEEVYNIRGEKGRSEFQSNEEIRKFRYHVAYAYKELLERINLDLNELSAPILESNEVPGIDEMQFPEHLPFSSTLSPKERTYDEIDNDILEQCKISLNNYIYALDEREQTDLVKYFWEKGYINFVELPREKEFPKFDWDNFDLSPFLECGNLGMLHLILLKRGYDLNPKEYKDILSSGTRDVIKEIVADVDLSMDIDGSRPLNCVLKRGFPDIAETLLAREADVIAVDRNECAPLHYAAMGGYLEVVNALLAKEEVGVNAVDYYTRMPLHYAAMGGYLEVVNALLAKEEVGVNAVDYYTRTPLHYAAENCHLEVVNALLAKEEDVNAADHDTRTPLHLAAKKGHVVVVNALLAKKEVDVNADDHDTRTPLHLAAENDHVVVVNALLEKEADVNAVDRNKRTPLH
ncbi:MAG: ankyrin repeat domain-containing protein, partial [Holosporaceae bacterium]|nr:ankyrin repeat domain-containing protein [Holosporaceae bacterium]